MEDSATAVESPKSPKTPKLSEEISEINLKSPLINDPIQNENSEEFKEDEVETIKEKESQEQHDEELIDPEDNPEFDQVKEILTQLIQNSPAGQLQNVSLYCKELFRHLEKFIERNCNDKMVKDGMITEDKLITEDNYEIQEPEIKEEMKEFYEKLGSKLDNYVNEFYPGTGKYLIHQSSENEWKIHVLGERIKMKAFWSGHWHSTWNLKFKSDQDQSNDIIFSINGKVDLIVHYHEEGTVQLSAGKEVTSRVDMKAIDFDQVADKIYWKIKDSEDSIQIALNEAYQQLTENSFKRLRRQLPVTRTKMDWAKFANYNLSTELKK